MKYNEKGVLAVVSGFSGAGKGTLMKALLDRYEEYALSISMTTRRMRIGEVDGESYFFVSRETFLEKIEQEDFIEHACYCDNYYGTPKAYVEQQLEHGKNVILEIEIQGALKIKEQYPEALLLFVMPPNAEELKSRLMGRGTETDEVIHQRLQRAVQEAEGIEEYDYFVVNDILDTCVEEIHRIIHLSHNQPNRNKEFINHIREELTSFSERG
ncbi:MAG: guanylate kinase [Eubacteriales bacterium]